MKVIILTLMMGLTFSCTQHRTLRGPASVDINYLSDDLIETTQNIKTLVKADNLPISACHNELRNTFLALKDLPRDHFSQAYSQSDRQRILSDLKEIKVGLKGQALKWKEHKVLDEGCVKATEFALKATHDLHQSLKS